MILQIKIAGLLLVVLSMIHLAFPRYFKWKEDFVPVSLINRQMMYIHTFFIGLSVFLMGLLCISSADEMFQTPLGKKISLGLAVFWLVRLAVQFLGYSNLLWKGKKFETRMHLVFSIFWIYLSGVFLMAGFS